VSRVLDIGSARQAERLARIAAALRAEWRMIAAVSLRPRGDGDGLDAEVRLDPTVFKGSCEQQGYPRSPEALARAEARRRDAVAACVDAVNVKLPPAEAIRSFWLVGPGGG
jgi:hypothetical protein